MSGFTKLFNSIVGSTIWQESPATKVVWITMLTMRDRGGVVEASIPGLAKLSGVTIEEAEVALTKFLSPDPYSSSPEHEGRRIERVDGGWRILNHYKYQEKMSKDDICERDRIRQQRYRELKKCHVKGVTKCDNRDKSRQSRHKDLDVSQPQKEESTPLGRSPNDQKVFSGSVGGKGDGKGNGDSFDPALDGSQAFEQFCECYPPNKVERGRYLQEAYMEAVFEVGKYKSLPTPGAVEWLKARATAYRSEKYPVGMQKWLEKEMYKQGAPAPVQLEPLIDRVRRQRGEIQ